MCSFYFLPARENSREFLRVESISKFIEDGVSIVTYSVCDDDNHATSATRKIRFVDYTDPVFVIKQSLVFGLGEEINLPSHIGAYDCIDGDISDKVTITATDYNTNEEGVFKVSLKATNSMGDSIYMELPVYIEDRSYSASQIDLSDYGYHHGGYGYKYTRYGYSKYGYGYDKK